MAKKSLPRGKVRDEDIMAIVAASPWVIFMALLLYDQLVKELRWDAECKARKDATALEYECLYPNDPCITDHPVQGVECDNCVKYGCIAAMENRKRLVCPK